MSRYVKGANFERQVIHQKIKEGAYVCVRGAGSKSYGKIKVDIMCLFDDTLELIQCKKGKQNTKKERQKFNSTKLPKYVEVKRVFIDRK